MIISVQTPKSWSPHGAAGGPQPSFMLFHFAVFQPVALCHGSLARLVKIPVRGRSCCKTFAAVPGRRAVTSPSANDRWRRGRLGIDHGRKDMS
ncbi:MAG: hypothetical protein ACFCUO_10090 [Rhodospirillales bacterium]